MFSALHEIENRKQVFEALDTIIKAKFIITPASPKNRIRRNDVHSAILGTINPRSGGGNWYYKKLIGEKLAIMGVRKLLSTGRRWFVNIQFRQEGVVNEAGR